MYGCKVAFLMYILIPFCRKCGWLCIFHEEFCEKDKFAYHIVDILRNLLFFMVYLLWTVLVCTVALCFKLAVRGDSGASGLVAPLPCTAYFGKLAKLFGCSLPQQALA